jgi:hypothetical protein
MKLVSIRNILDYSITIGWRTVYAVRNTNENLEKSKIWYKMCTREEHKVN